MKTLAQSLLLTPLLLFSGSANALPDSGPDTFCNTYPTVPACRGGTASCLTCHSSPPNLNSYGLQVQEKLTPGGRGEALAEALRAVEQQDADSDGWSNIDELVLGTHPASSISAHKVSVPSEAALASTEYTLGTYDPAFALRRLKVAFCGTGPSFEEVQAIKGSDDGTRLLHNTLSDCLKSSYWTREAVPRLADSRIRPLVALGTCETMIADFEYDYRLFAYAMTGGHDARDILLADYHVERGDTGELSIIDESTGRPSPPTKRGGLTCSDPFGNSPPVPGGQALAPEHRAGMLTTEWFLVINTQASYLPRTTAAAAYRHWLGFNIATFGGMFPIAGEPRDVDDIGIDASPCYQCHSTLDPLAYAFAYYNGVGFAGPPGSAPPTIGAYVRNRPTNSFTAPAAGRAAWMDSTPIPHALGQPIPAEETLGDSTGLVQMARIFADSSAFATNISRLLWTLTMGSPPGPGEYKELDEVTKVFRASQYSVDALIHAIVDTQAFGAP